MANVSERIGVDAVGRPKQAAVLGRGDRVDSDRALCNIQRRSGS